MDLEKIAALVGDCIADLLAGRRTVEQCLSDHPEARQELAPALQLAARIHRLPLSPDPGRKALAREDFMAAIGFDGLSLPGEMARNGGPHWVSEPTSIDEIQPWLPVEPAEPPATLDVRMVEPVPQGPHGW